MTEFWKILADFTIYFSLVYPLLYLKAFAKNNRAYKIFTIYLIVVGLIALLMYLVIKLFEYQSNLFLSHWYFILQFVLLSLFYRELLKFKWIYYILALSLFFLGYQYVSDPGLYNRYNALGMVSTQIVIVFYALLYMYRSLSAKKEFTIVNIGIFVYLMASSLIFASGNLVFNIEVPVEFSDLLANINTVLYLAFQILIFVEWWKNYSVQRTK